MTGAGISVSAGIPAVVDADLVETACWSDPVKSKINKVPVLQVGQLKMTFVTQVILI